MRIDTNILGAAEVAPRLGIAMSADGRQALEVAA
jgi:hypothetical protein